MIQRFQQKTLTTLTAALMLFSARPFLAQQKQPLSVGASYTYVRTNLLPDCNCFGLNGGDGEVQLGIGGNLSLLGDMGVARKSNITVNRYDLIRITYSGGVRYSSPFRMGRIQPFGDLLLGGAHTSGSLSPDATGHGGANAFLFETGGGFGIRVGSRWTIVPVRAAYQLTTFSNGQDDRQNNLRLSVGIRLHLTSTRGR